MKPKKLVINPLEFPLRWRDEPEAEAENRFLNTCLGALGGPWVVNTSDMERWAKRLLRVRKEFMAAAKRLQ